MTAQLKQQAQLDSGLLCGQHSDSGVAGAWPVVACQWARDCAGRDKPKVRALRC